MKKHTSKEETEIVKRALPAIFGKTAVEISPRYIEFNVDPAVFCVIRKWLDQHNHMDIFTAGACRICIINREAVAEYNKGRDPEKGYPKDFRE